MNTLASATFALLAACTGAGDDTDDTDDTGPVLDPIPDDTLPCESPEYWSRALEPDDLPLIVHYRPGQDAKATEVLGYLEHSWEVEVDELGFRPPLPDGGRCGPDDKFDVFLWRGIDEAYVDALEENPETAWDDWSTYLVIDAWGPYGGDILDATVAHEFNHACQASDDWFDSPIIFEMTSTFMEDVVYDDDNNYVTLLQDFQQHPDWSLDRNDDYDTWYMYAAVLYLHYVRDRFFDGDPSFIADMWLGMRNPAGDDEPDFEDALDDLLTTAAGVSYLDSVVEFARWRWYVGPNDDGAHFEEAATWANVAIRTSIYQSSMPLDQSFDVMALGSAYIQVMQPARISIATADPGVTWVFQTVPGTTTDGDTIDLAAGPVTLETAKILIATALPLTADADPDERTDHHYPITLHFEVP